MNLQKEIIRILYIYVQQQKKLTITFGSLTSLIQNYAQKFKKERPELEPLAQDTATILPPELYQLEQDEHIRIRRGQTSQEIFSVTYTGYFHAALKDWYKKMLENPDMSFPSKTFLNNEISEKGILNADVSENFQQILRSDEIKDNALINLHFGGPTSDILIVKQILHNNLEDICFLKLQQFLQRGKNSIHLTAKLSKDENIHSIVNETIKNLAQRPIEERNRFQNPPTNYYHLWMSICKVLNQQLMNITTQNTTLEGQLQATKILHEYISYYYEQKRQDQQKARVLQKTTDTIKSPPYVHSVAHLEQISVDKDHNSRAPIDVETFREHLSKLALPNRISSVPEIVQFKTPDGSEYIIASDRILQYLNKDLVTTRERLHETFSSQMINQYNENKEIEFLKKNVDLEPTVEKTLKLDYPILYSLLNYRIIDIGIMANKDPDYFTITENITDQANEKLLPYCTIMQISKEELKKEASYILPIWALIPAISSILKLLARLLNLFRKSSSLAEPAPLDNEFSAEQFLTPSSERKGEPIVTQRIVDDHKHHKARSKPTDAKEKLAEMKTELQELLEQWNTIIDPKVRNNITQDVNSLCRDSLRIIWRGSGVPDEKRVKELAVRISQNEQFQDRVQNKKALTRYIEVYMNTIVYSAIGK